MSSNLVFVYIITGAVSVVIAFLLVYFSTLSDNLKKTLDKNKKRAERLDRNTSVEEPLERVIYNELTNIVDSERDREQVTRVVSDMFNKELDKKVSLHLLGNPVRRFHMRTMHGANRL